MRKTFLLVAALCAPLAFAQDAVALKRIPKEGESAKYTLKVDTELGGMKIKFSAKVVEKVTKVNPDGTFVVSSEQHDIVLNVDGNDTAAPAEVGGAVTTTYRTDGTVSDMQGDQVDADGYRMSNIQVVVWPKDPVKVGSKWESDIKADKDKGTVDVHTTYEVLASEKVGTHDCFKVAYDAAEKGSAAPAESKGTVWIDVTNGQIVKGEMEWTNAPIAKQMISGKVTLELND